MQESSWCYKATYSLDIRLPSCMPRQHTLFTVLPNLRNEWWGAGTRWDAPQKWLRVSVKQQNKTSYQTRFLTKADGARMGVGGRYLVTFSNEEIAIWDLGYTSHSSITLVASVGIDFNYSPLVQATEDGRGLILVMIYWNQTCSVFEIYAQSKEPYFIQIASHTFRCQVNLPYYYAPHTIVWCFEHYAHVNYIYPFRSLGLPRKLFKELVVSVQY